MIVNMLKWQVYTICFMSILAYISHGRIAFLTSLLSGIAILLPNCLMAVNQLVFKLSPTILITGMLLKPVLTGLLLLIVVQLLVQVYWMWFILSVVVTITSVKTPYIINTFFKQT